MGFPHTIFPRARIHRSFALLPSAFSQSTFSRQIHFHSASFPMGYRNWHLLTTFSYKPWACSYEPCRTRVSSKARCASTMVTEG